MIKNNKYKTVLCRNWVQKKCIHDKSKCIFAHGEDDIKNNIKSKCINFDNCYNENCLYGHSDEWNPYNNKKDCDFCLKGFCEKRNIKYRHIYDKDYNKLIENNETKKINIQDEKEFPQLLKCNDHEENNIVLKSKKKDDHYLVSDRYNQELSNIKNELYDSYKSLSKLDSWSDSMDIEDNINLLRRKYNILKEKLKKEDIFNNELNLKILESNDDTKIEIPNISLTINGVNINGNDKNIDILKTINNMEDYINVCINNIKYKLDNKINKDNKLDDIVLNYKIQLNRFMSKLYLLKLNSSDLEEVFH